jgi:hypothetical protein
MKTTNEAIRAAREASNKIQKLRLELDRKITVVHEEKYEDLEFRIISKTAGHRLQTKNFAGDWRDETTLTTLEHAKIKLEGLKKGETPKRKMARAKAKISWERNHKK